MPLNVSRGCYYSTHTSSGFCGTRPISSGSYQCLPPLRSVLGEQLDLPVRSCPGSYDLGEMSEALPSFISIIPEYRARGKSNLDTYLTRGREHLLHPDRKQRSYTFPPGAPSAVVQSGSNKGLNAYGYERGQGRGHQTRMMTPMSRSSGYLHSPSLAPSKDERGQSTKKYMCTWPRCDKRFERQNALDTHMNIHTEEKPFACPVPHCGKVFNVRSNMRRHLLTHKDCQQTDKHGSCGQ